MTPTPFGSVFGFVVGVCLSYYNLNSFCNTPSVLFKRIPVVPYAWGSFGKHLKNRQIPDQSVRGPFVFLSNLPLIILAPIRYFKIGFECKIYNLVISALFDKCQMYCKLSMSQNVMPT